MKGALLGSTYASVRINSAFLPHHPLDRRAFGSRVGLADPEETWRPEKTKRRDALARYWAPASLRRLRFQTITRLCEIPFSPLCRRRDIAGRIERLEK